MTDFLAIEQTDIYHVFCDIADEMEEVEIDAEGVWMCEEDNKLVADADQDIKEIYWSGVLGSSYRDIRVIAAIAFCDTAEIVPFDYVGAGGEKYDD